MSVCNYKMLRVNGEKHIIGNKKVGKEQFLFSSSCDGGGRVFSFASHRRSGGEEDFFLVNIFVSIG